MWPNADVPVSHRTDDKGLGRRKSRTFDTDFGYPDPSPAVNNEQPRTRVRTGKPSTATVEAGTNQTYDRITPAKLGRRIEKVLAMIDH